MENGTWMIRFARCTLLVLLAGYLIFNKPFALLGVAPVYVGEVALLILLFTSLIHFRTFWIEPLKSSWLPRLTLVFLVYGSIRVMVDIVGHYPNSMDAARDGVCVGYALFALLAPTLLDGYFEMLLIGASLPALSWTILNQFVSVTSELPQVVAVNTKPDMLSLSALVAAWVFGYAALERYFSIQFLRNLPTTLIGFDPRVHNAELESWQRSQTVMVSIFRITVIKCAVFAALAVVFVFSMRARAAWLAAAVLITFLIALNIRRLLNRYVLAIAAVAAALIWFAGVPWFEQSHSPFVEKVRATFGAQPAQLVVADAQNTALNTEWRRIFWKRCIEQTAQRAPWFGLGFGVNLTDLMRDTPDWPLYIPSQQLNPPNRNPHNAAVTIFSRTGFVGFTLWAALILWTGVSGFWKCMRKPNPPAPFPAREGGADEAGRMRAILLFGVWLIYLSYALVGDVIENPFGGIWFWVLTGAVGSLNVCKAESTSAPDAGAPDIQLAKAST